MRRVIPRDSEYSSFRQPPGTPAHELGCLSGIASDYISRGCGSFNLRFVFDQCNACDLASGELERTFIFLLISNSVYEALELSGA